MSSSGYVPVFDCGIAGTAGAGSSTAINSSEQSGMNIFDSSKYSAQPQWRVPKLDVSRSRSYSRQSSSSSFADLDCTNSSISSVISNTPKESSYNPKVSFPAPPLPKASRTAASSTSHSNVKDFMNGTHNSLYNNYAIPPQAPRISRSSSGSSLTDFFPQQSHQQFYQQEQKQQQQQFQQQQQQQQQYSQYSLAPQRHSASFLNVYQQQQQQQMHNPYIPFVASIPAISPQTSTLIKEFKKRKVQIQEDFDSEAGFERSVQSSLRDLQYLGTRKQDIMRDCISDLNELYTKYLKDDFSLAEELLSSRRSLRLETSGYENSEIGDESEVNLSQSQIYLNESNLHDDLSVISDA